MTSAMPVQCSNQLSYEVTQLRAGQFVGLMFSRERNANTAFWTKGQVLHRERAPLKVPGSQLF